MAPLRLGDINTSQGTFQSERERGKEKKKKKKERRAFAVWFSFFPVVFIYNGPGRAAADEQNCLVKGGGCKIKALKINSRCVSYGTGEWQPGNVYIC